jgi:RNase P/RNase MRP subunit p29
MFWLDELLGNELRNFVSTLMQEEKVSGRVSGEEKKTVVQDETL